MLPQEITNLFTIYNEMPELKSIKSKEELLKTLDVFNKKKVELIFIQQQIQQSLVAIENKEKEFQVKIAELDKAVRKTGVLIINKDQIIKSTDGSGEREHYKLTLISKDDTEIEIGKEPIDIKKYGNIKHIVIRDGTLDTVLEDSETTQRLVRYLTATNFDAFRLELNRHALDRNNHYPNKHQRFDCQSFCHYMQHGKEGSYSPWSHSTYTSDFKNEGALHKPGRFYKITATTTNFGRNGQYSSEDISVHYYVCLANDVFVSKFGSSNLLFTSYKQITDAYFPAKFIKGNRDQV